MSKKYYLFLFLLLYYRRIFSKYYFKRFLTLFPFVNKKIESINNSLLDNYKTDYKHIKVIPKNSYNEDDLLEKIKTMSKCKKTHISGVIYCNNNTHNKKLLKIFELFSKSNPLHADIFPEIRNMEIDIIKMASEMFKGDFKTCGNVTSGGTESILLACYTYREYCLKNHGITNPNIVTFTSVHPAFDKACHLFNIKLRKAKSLFALKWLVDWNTICVVASAPTYSYGIVDPIDKISDFCLRWRVPLHIDCCMGGFLLPFLDDNPVTFEKKGITSISADTHKYGYCFKGSSVLLFRNKKIKLHQHFVKTDWEGGIYATPTLLGSKSGALIATTWASLLYTGKNNYATIAKRIRYLLNKIKNHYKNNKNITVIGNPDLNIIAFKSDILPIYSIANEMKNWHLAILSNPPAFHLCITSSHDEDFINRFIEDLDKAISSVINNPKKLDGSLAIYGSATKVENSLFVNDVVSNYLLLLSSDKI